MFTRVETWALALVLSLAGCDHSQPFSYAPPGALGPFTSGSQRQITFNPGDDRFPSVQGGVVAYSYRAPERTDRDWCVAVLPDTGGQRVHDLCPSGPADNYVDAWRHPALSPDTQSVIFWKERGLKSNTVPAVRDFVRVDWARPDSQIEVLTAPYFFPDSTAGNAVREVTWPAPNTLRFVAGLETVDLFTTDTIFTPYGIAEFDLSTHALRLLPGTAGAGTYANAQDGGVWFIAADNISVVHQAPGASATDTIATFPYAVTDLANAGGVPVAIVLSTLGGIPTPTFGYVTPGSTQFNVLSTSAVPLGLAASPDSPVVVGRMLGANGLGKLWMVAR